MNKLHRLLALVLCMLLAVPPVGEVLAEGDFLDDEIVIAETPVPELTPVPTEAPTATAEPVVTQVPTQEPTAVPSDEPSPEVEAMPSASPSPEATEAADD